MTRKPKPKAVRKPKRKARPPKPAATCKAAAPEPERKGRGQPAYRPTDKDRTTVRMMIGYGIKQDDVCAVIGISDVTLRKHFPQELAAAAIEANAIVAQSLFQMATKGGNVAAAIWWEKTRRGLSERLILEARDAEVDLASLSDADIAARIAMLQRGTAARTRKSGDVLH